MLYETENGCTWGCIGFGTCVSHCPQDAIIIKNSNLIELKHDIDLELSSLENITLKPIYSAQGINYGIIKDVELNSKYKIENIETSTSNIDTHNIVKINKVVVVSENKICINRYKPKPQFNTTINYPVEISTPRLPLKASINESLLLNRTVYHNILDSNNNVIIRQNSIINNNTIELAKKHGKLKELTRYSF
jgi:ferredoxin